LGGRMPATRRSELVRWARGNGAWVIEDDYDGELRYDVAPLPLLAALGPDVVIHLGTSSKIISPTLGVGWLVAPPDATSAVVAYRETAGASPSLAAQRVLTALADSGDLSHHLRRLRRELAARRDGVVQRLGAAGLDVLGDKAGAHVVVPLPDAEAEVRAVDTAARAGVRVDGLAQCFVGEPSLSGVTVGYAALATRDMLESALPALARVLVTAAGGPPR
ncbi:MAG: aminotransferase class I/II-fold pyridoxal phosphate-dependent enzyme, partial [bacterium]